MSKGDARRHVDDEDGEYSAAISAAELQAPSARTVHDAIRREGEEELRRAVSSLAWSGFACGLSMGLSLLVEGLLHAHLPASAWRPLVSNLGYSVGFIVVVLGRQQLFTENTLTPVLPLLHQKRASTLLLVLRLWAVVLVMNLLGAFAFSSVLASTSFFPIETRAAFQAIGEEAIRHPFGPTLLGGIFAGWLIALMVWLIPYAGATRLWTTALISYVVGLAGFAHIIAGSTEVFYLVADGDLSLPAYLYRFFLPALVGNMLGGVTLVAVLNHGQVVKDQDS